MVQGKICVGGLILFVFRSSVYTHRCLLSASSIWPSIIFPLDYLRDILCSCHTDLWRSSALSFFMFGNHFVVSWLHCGKEMGTLFPESPNCSLPNLWILYFNHCLLAPQARVPVFGQSFSLSKLHSPKHCGFVLDSSLYPYGFRLLETQFKNTLFFFQGWAILYFIGII